MSTNISTSVSIDDNFCKCARRTTRAFSQAIQLGDFCPSCGLRLSNITLLRAKTLDRLNSSPEPEPIYQNFRYQHSSSESLSSSTSDTDYTLPERNMDLAAALQELAITLREQKQPDFKPLPFKAAPKQDLDTFLTKFENWCNYTNKTDDERLQIIPFLLQEKAFDIYESLSDEIKNDYDQLKTELRNHLSLNWFSIVESTSL